MKVEELTQSDWNRPLRTPADSLTVLKRAAVLYGGEVEVVKLEHDTYCFCRSSEVEDGFELFGDIVSPWSVPHAGELIRYLIDSKRYYLLNQVDGGWRKATETDSGALVVPSNAIAMNEHVTWDDFLSDRTKKHRARIKQNLSLASTLDIRVEDYRYVSTPAFEELLTAQSMYLKEKYWSPSCDAACVDSCQSVWSAWITAIATTREVNPKIWVVRVDGDDIVATITATINGRRFFIITLQNPDFSEDGVGLAALATAVKASFEDPSVRIFDMMMGKNHYKRMYEPDMDGVTYMFCVHPTEFWLDPSADVAMIPTPPFIAGGSIYTLEKHPYPGLE